MDTISTSSDECFICMEESDEPAINLLNYEITRQCHCSAKLHAKCYARWLRENQSCPICREPILMRIVQPQNIHEFVLDDLPNYSIIHVERDLRNIFFSMLILLLIIFLIITIIIVFLYFF